MFESFCMEIMTENLLCPFKKVVTPHQFHLNVVQWIQNKNPNTKITSSNTYTLPKIYKNVHKQTSKVKTTSISKSHPFLFKKSSQQEEKNSNPF